MNQLGTKAETLRLLYGKLNNAKVLPQYVFTVREWTDDSERIKEEFAALEWNAHIIVRSSSLSEDTAQESQAGKYESVANISGLEDFERAVGTVIASYDDCNEDNQVLVQPMLSDVKICGVAFTLDPNTCGNYYVVNYDESGSTDAVTSGNGKQNRLLYCFKDADRRDLSAEMQRLVETLAELERFFGQDNLDVEFAFDGMGVCYILQVRALCVGSERIAIDEQKGELERIAHKVCAEQSKKPFLCGDKVVYSVMTDWNPAEMIGIRPKPLALSLYREIVTDSIWAYQRDNYGYRNLRSFPLMVDFCGLPYIDVRVSFNSFVPAELDENISEKLVNYYLDRLIEAPWKHDKAEFEIVFSCYTLDLPERIAVLGSYGFTAEETEQIVNALRNITNRIIDYGNGFWKKDYRKIHILEQRYEEVMSSDMDRIEKAYWLLEDCKRYGTLPFAGLARGAFVAVQLLKSMVTCGILTTADYELFMKNVNTVSSNMRLDKKNMSKTAFIKKYGHLRPGTYDITSLRYDENPDLYFDWGGVSAAENNETAHEPFKMSLEQLNCLKEKLTESGLTNDILGLMDYIRIVIEGREYGKFVFSRNLSKALSLISEIGAENGLSKRDCEYLDIQAVRNLYSSTKDIKESLLRSIEAGKAAYKNTKSIVLPPFLRQESEVWNFYYPDTEPNYITTGRTAGEAYLLKDDPEPDKMTGKIVFIASADPGYDWIFSHHIAGFITMHGGANSHMAIRAGELGIPAVIGVGEKVFDKYKCARNLEIDCAAKTIRVQCL